MTKNRLYIAYGSNLHLPQMAFRCPTVIQQIIRFKFHHYQSK